MTGKKASWTAAGAARLALDARIAAVRYMTGAQIERDWYARMLEHGHQVRAASGNPVAARALQFATMGYEAAPPRWIEASAIILADELRHLAAADLYVLSPQMLDVVVAAAQTLTFEDLSLLTAEDLPSPTGALLLPRPLVIRLPNGGRQEDLAYTWRSPARIPLPPGLDFELPGLPAVRMSSYQSARRARRRDFTVAARQQGIVLPPVLLDNVWAVPVHPAGPAQARDCARLAGQMRRLNGDYWRGEASRTALAEAAGETSGQYLSGEPVDEDPDGTFASRFLYAFWRLCQQEIALPERREPNHSSQVIAARAGVAADVRVVTLRRRSSARPAGQAGPHEWHHQWPVRMHPVHQYFPSLGQHKVIYRGPYIKGPADKPMIGGQVVRGLVK